jgi:hypothetical protein
LSTILFKHTRDCPGTHCLASFSNSEA